MNELENNTLNTAGSCSSDHCCVEKTMEEKLAEKDEEIKHLRHQLEKSERQLEKSRNYNDDLRKEITKLSSELHNYRHIVSIDACIQVLESEIEEAYDNKPMPEWRTNTCVESGSLSIAESLRAAAEAELQNQEKYNTDGQAHGSVTGDQTVTDASSDYIYDANTGFYYHPATGYYWDPNNNLFYDYITGTYYQHNSQTGEYEVHSRIDVTVQSHAGFEKAEHTKEAARKTSRHKHKKRKADSGHENPRESRKRRTKYSKKVSKTKIRKKLGKAEKDEVVIIDDNDADMQGNLDSDLMQDAKEKAGDLGVIQDEALENTAERVADNLKVGKSDEDGDSGSESSGSLATGESELMSEPESGEISSDSSSDVEILETMSETHRPIPMSDAVEMPSLDEMAENYPPCIRVIVQESEHVGLGSLYIVTCAGGTIGREPNMGHVIEIPDVNVSKLHAQIEYDYDNNCYTVSDKGSQNGTVLNSSRLSKSKSESGCQPLNHGDILQVGGTKLLLHIHKGHQTCEDCEPGQVQAKLKAQNPIKNDYVILSQEEKHRQRKKELKNIKKKYGLQNASYENPGAVIKNPDYCDKAHLRRKFIGSEPNIPKVEDSPASVQSPISSENKGHKLLAKMGWKEGEGLGKTGSGIAEPINVEMRVNQSAGLGSAAGVSLSLDKVQQAGKTKRWAQAQQRYHKLEERKAGSGDGQSDLTNETSTTALSSHHPALRIRPENSNITQNMRQQNVTLASDMDSGDAVTFNQGNVSVKNSQGTFFTARDPYLSGDDKVTFSQDVRKSPETKKSKPKISWVQGATEHMGLLNTPGSQQDRQTSDNEQTNNDKISQESSP